MVGLGDVLGDGIRILLYFVVLLALGKRICINKVFQKKVLPFHHSLAEYLFAFEIPLQLLVDVILIY